MSRYIVMIVAEQDRANRIVDNCRKAGNLFSMHRIPDWKDKTLISGVWFAGVRKGLVELVRRARTTS